VFKSTIIGQPFTPLHLKDSCRNVVLNVFVDVCILKILLYFDDFDA